MTGLLSYFAQRRLLANMITLLIIVLGAVTIMSIKRDSFPDLEFGEVLITTKYPGASPQDVELKVTNEIEKELKSVVGIKEYKSWSLENVSIIMVVIDADEDQDDVNRDIREAVNRVTDLPSEVTESPLITELGTSSFPMIEVGLAGNVPYRQLRELARGFEKKLEQIPGVASVERFGYRAREVIVEVKPDKMKQHLVSLRDIVTAIKGRNIQSTGGSFESYTSEKNIVTMAEFIDPMEVGDVIVNGTFSGPLVKIKDLAIVKDDFEQEKVMSRINGQSAISFIAYKKKSADIIRTVRAIRALIEEEQRFMPDGVDILLSNDVSVHVKNRFDIVLTNGLIGLLLVLIVLSLSLNLRVAFWVGLGIPVVILGVIFLLPLFGVFLDSVSMTAMVLVLGIVVDDAIIISENIYRKFEQGLSPVDAAVQGVSGVAKPVITTIFTTFIAFAPLFFMPGMLGKFVHVIPLVISLALLVSLLECLFALPAHLTAGFEKSQRNASGQQVSNLSSKFGNYYLKLMYKFLKVRYLLVVLFICVFAAAIHYAYRSMDFILFPSSTADRFMIFMETPIGTSLAATSSHVTEVENLVSRLGHNELDSYVTRVGTYGVIGASESENTAAIFVSLTPFAGRQRTADQVVEDLRQQVNQLVGFKQVRFEIDSGGPPVGRPIVVRVTGTDDGLRNKLAGDVVTYLKSLKGTKDIDRDDVAGKDQVEIRLDYEKLARIGISVADVAQNVRIAYDGEVVTSVRYGDEDVDFRVIFDSSERNDVIDLQTLMLPNRNNRLTPLSQVAYFDTGPGPSNFHHFNGDRSITVSGDVDQAVTTALDVAQSVLSHFNLHRDYPGMRLIIGGEAEESEQSLTELLFIFGISILGIYCLLILLFNSIWQPLLVMVSLPFGIIGVIVGFAIHDAPLGFLAVTGIIGLAGVVVNDALVLINHVNELKRTNPQLTSLEVVAQGTVNRLRAVGLTTVSTVAGLLPLAYGVGGSDPYMSPMALALGWGLLFAMPLTLVLLPCIYLIADDLRSITDRVMQRT